ncbi:MAG: hypothetical protein EXX96DRAFT_558958 [Benjaminiella poitrasii]|nr:MAG: hypothetical protein EXX96DRAFT_558958 [Benjaminiella poitrasii]
MLPEQQRPPHQPKIKKKVTFTETPEIFLYEPLESEDEDKELGIVQSDNEEEEEEEEDERYLIPQHQQAAYYDTIDEDNNNNRRRDEQVYYDNNEDDYYTHHRQSLHYPRSTSSTNNHLYDTASPNHSRQRRPTFYSNTDNGRYHPMYHDNNGYRLYPQPYYYQGEEEEDDDEDNEDYGALWKRRELIQRRHSRYRS